MYRVRFIFFTMIRPVSKKKLKFFFSAVLCVVLFRWFVIKNVLCYDTQVYSVITPSNNCSLHKQLNTDGTMVTIFTTFEFSSTKFNSNLNSLKNWKAVRGINHFVLFTNCRKARSLGESLNFTVLPVTDSAIGGVPVLKTMFLTVLSLFPTSYVMYSNADIVFDVDSMDTVTTVDNYVKKRSLMNKPVMIVGRRTNLDIEKVKVESWEDVVRKSYYLGARFRYDALDYFIVNRNFPWDEIPKFVIGRVGYDNWIVAFSRFNNFTVVDASNSIIAVHQTVKGRNFEGSTHHNFSYNLDLVEKSRFPFKLEKWGRTDCCNLATEYNINCGQIYVLKRTRVPSSCFQHNLSYYMYIKSLFRF